MFSSNTRDYSGNICPLLKTIGNTGQGYGVIQEKDINEYLSYLYRKASIEVESFKDKKTVEKLCLEYEGVLLCRQSCGRGGRICQPCGCQLSCPCPR